MELFYRKLSHGARLTDADRRRLDGLRLPFREAQPHQDILPAGSEPRWLPLIVRGWACRYRVLENGKRQIVSIYLPGDLCEPYGILPCFMDTTVAALTQVLFIAVSPSALKAAAAESPAIEQALWWDLLAASAVEREHIVSLGRRSAVERLGHLFCELHLRSGLVGLCRDDSYELPVTQIELSDMLGLTAVHVNRSLQELRRTGLISLSDRRLVIHDLEGLRELSLFDPGYLNLADPAAAPGDR